MYSDGEPPDKVVKQPALGKDPECEATHRANCFLNSDAKVLNWLRFSKKPITAVQVSQYELPIQAEVALSKANRPPRKTISQVLLSAHTPTNAKSHTIHGDSAANFWRSWQVQNEILLEETSFQISSFWGMPFGADLDQRKWNASWHTIGLVHH